MIFVGAWMDARDVHIAKYIARYQALYPTAQILLVKCPIKHIRQPSVAAKAIVPAVPIIREAVGGSDATAAHQKQPELLVHVFSNGGSSSLYHLYAAYAATASSSDAVLPLHTTVFDSAPGRWTFGRMVAALRASVPPRTSWVLRVLVLAPLFRAMTVVYWLLYFAPWPGRDGRMEPLARYSASHNDPVRVREARRAYIYSEEDELVGADAVEDHAAEAEAKGFKVRTERFAGSKHVAHVRLDETRYWEVVEQTWEGISDKERGGED